MFKIQKNLCTNCRLCMLACTSAHEQNIESTKLARIYIENNWPSASSIHVCMACPKKSCIESCPTKALSWQGHVVLDEDSCDRCGICFAACPFEGIQEHPGTKLPLICDTCNGQFSCIKTCPTGAIIRR